jgi:hypothetical protein
MNTAEEIQETAAHLRSLIDTVIHDAHSADELRVLSSGIEALALETGQLDTRTLAARLGTLRPATHGMVLASLAGAVLSAESARRSLTPREKLARAHLSGVIALREQLADEGGVYTASEVASLLGISRQAVHKRTRAGQLLGIEEGERTVYPVWQFDGAAVLDGLPDILGAFLIHSPIARLRFFLAPNARLGGESPIEALRDGRRHDVLKAARSFGLHGAA